MNNQRTMRALNFVSIVVLIGSAGVAYLRFGPPEIRARVENVGLYLEGRAQGCGVLNVVYASDFDLHAEGLRIMDKVRPVDVDGTLILIDSPMGQIWTPANNDILILLAEQRLDLYQTGPGAVSEGDVVLDCGANVGTFSRVALDRGAALVVAVEPSPSNVKALHRNFEKEIAEGRVIVVPKALWSEAGSMMLQTYELSVLDSLVMRDRPSAGIMSEVEVDLVTIDEVVRELDLHALDFIKMDIEGAEREAMQGAARTLTRFRPYMAIATENLPDDIEAVPAAVLAIEPSYEMTTGRCRRIEMNYLRPEVVYFTPAESAQAD